MKHSSQPGTFARFVSYYKGQGGLFWADMACALIVAGIDLAFPQILRTLSSGLFASDAAEILSALGTLLA